MMALSVSSSNSRVSGETGSPSASSHLRMVPSSMEIDAFGIVTGVGTTVGTQNTILYCLSKRKKFIVS